jgi:threonine/homoserine/homoserine lactone efflux protein
MDPFLQGILVGLTFAVLLGPAFFSLIQTSIHRGFRSWAFLAIGIFLSDFTALLLTYFGATQFLGSDPRENFLFSIIGGIILVIFGTYTVIRKVADPAAVDDGSNDNKPSPFYVYIIKGFLLNAANPGMWFVWITVVVSISARFGVNNDDNYIFLVGVLGSIFATDLLKCFISNQIKHFLNLKVMVWMNRLVGIILIAFGTYLIINILIDLESMISIYKEVFKKNK